MVEGFFAVYIRILHSYNLSLYSHVGRAAATGNHDEAVMMTTTAAMIPTAIVRYAFRRLP